MAARIVVVGAYEHLLSLDGLLQEAGYDVDLYFYIRQIAELRKRQPDLVVIAASEATSATHTQLARDLRQYAETADIPIIFCAPHGVLEGEQTAWLRAQRITLLPLPGDPYDLLAAVYEALEMQIAGSLTGGSYAPQSYFGVGEY